MKITKLKGGSLNVTTLHFDHAYSSNNFVRKSISLKNDREYGYVRWYSQLKRMQQMKSYFPEYIPSVLRVNVTEDGNTAYFDMEYLENYRDMKVVLCDTVNPANDRTVEDMHALLWKGFDRIFSSEWQATVDGVGNAMLYFKEEVLQKIQDGLLHPEFKQFFDLGSYKFHGQSVKGVDEELLKKYADDIKSILVRCKIKETRTLGNPTLENIMYLEPHLRNSSRDAIKFIDLYGESVLDIPHMEYSQILQCSSSKYGFINDREVFATFGGHVGHNLTIPPALEYFNDLFNDELKRRLSVDEYRLVKLLEVTHFFRMIPFKCLTGDYVKAKYFYVHACYMLRALFS